MIPLKSLAALLMLFWGTAFPASAEEIAVIELRHRPAEELIPLLKPLLEPNDNLVPNHNQLIIKASPARINALRTVLDQIDQRPHRLRVTVAQGNQLSAAALNGGIAIGAGNGRRGVAFQGQFSASRQQDQNQANQFVQTLDGQTAMIEIGQAVPLLNRDGYNGGGVTYQPVTTGFAVAPRLTEDREVQIAIEPWPDRLYRGGIINTQSVSTRLRAPLGSWVELGSIAQTHTTQGNDPSHPGYADRELGTRTFLKLDDLDAGQR